MRSNLRSRRGHTSARTKPALFVAFIFAAALALSGNSLLDNFVPGLRAAAQGNTVVINEIDYDQTGTDSAEFVELKNTGSAAVNLDNYTVELVNAGTNPVTVYDTIDLPNVNLAAGDYYVICANNATVANCDLDDGPNTNFIQNGNPDAIGLKLSGTLVDAVSYGGNTTGYTETTGIPTTATDTADPFLGISRFPDGADSNNNSNDFSRRCITPGTANLAASSDCAPPNLNINDVSQSEGNSGTTTFAFTVSLSKAAGPGGVTFDIATADGTAQDDNPGTENEDYVAQSLTGQTIPEGQTTYTSNVAVNGDTDIEPTETFFVNVTNVTGATVADGQGLGTIQNDDSPNLSINDVTQDEGNGGGTNDFLFNVTLSSSAHGGVTFDICTANGTATAGEDYEAKCLTNQTIAGGSTTYQFAVPVVRDATTEPNETFFVNITNMTGATFAPGGDQAVGTIVNDELTKSICEIQGNGTASPHTGEVHTTTGIVTARRSSGFYIQQPNCDSDPNTSDGVFVFGSSAAAAVAVGDRVRVTGTVVEFVPNADPNQNPLTELTGPTVVTVSTGNTLPDPVTLTAAETTDASETTEPLDTLEEYEGMRVSVPSMTVVAPTSGFINEPSATSGSNGVFYAVVTGVARPFREPGIPVSDPVPSPVPSPNNIPRFDENPERLRVDSDGQTGAAALDVATGTIVTGVVGVVDYSFRTYTIFPDPSPAPGVSAQPTYRPAPAAAPHELSVASFNTFHFYDTVNDDRDPNTNGDQTGDEVLTQAAYDNRLTKMSRVIRDVLNRPDVLAVQEVEKLSVLQDIANRVNADAGTPGDYVAYLEDGQDIGGINVGYLVRSSRVGNVTVTQVGKDATFVDPGDGSVDILHDRPPLVLEGTATRPGFAPFDFTVVNVHLRSLNDVEADNATGRRVRAKRRAAAEWVADYVQDRQVADPSERIVVVGDFNAFQFNDGYVDVIGTIKGQPAPPDQVVLASPDLVNPDLVDLVDTLPAAERYSYTFDGNAQVLDHALVNDDANARLSRFLYARNNADFPTILYQDTTRPERISDHDMPVAYFNIANAPQAGQLLINEFRHFGPDPDDNGPQTGEEDEFVEIYNNTDAEHIVASVDGSAGYSIATAADQTAGTPRCVIENGTRIPARGYFLCANSDGYSLDNHPSGSQRSATADETFTADIPVNAGLALFSTANTANYDADTRLDAAGPVSETNALYKESPVAGGGYPDITDTTPREYSFFRDLRTGLPKDTNNNAADFFYVSTDGENAGAGARLGAPGPQNLDSPIQRNAVIKASLIDPSCNDLGFAIASTAPGASPDGTPVTGCQNTVRDPTPLTVTQPQTSVQGSFFIRRRFRNNTMQNVTRLRFRVVDITAKPAPLGTADLRLLTSGAVTYTTTGGDAVTVQGLILEEEPTQALGGGHNSSVRCCTDAGMAIPTWRTISLLEPLAPNHTIDVQFRFGVMEGGAYRFFINVEAELQPLPPVPASPTKSRSAAPKR